MSRPGWFVKVTWENEAVPGWVTYSRFVYATDAESRDDAVAIAALGFEPNRAMSASDADWLLGGVEVEEIE